MSHPRDVSFLGEAPTSWLQFLAEGANHFFLTQKSQNPQNWDSENVDQDLGF